MKVRKAVIPVAGMGTRFLPVTKAIPKEMLPIIDKPTLQYIVEEAVESGIEEILFIISPYKQSIMDHFDNSYELEHRLLENGKEEKYKEVHRIPKLCNISYKRQGKPLGSGHAIKLAKDFVGNEPFAVMYGDDLMQYEVPVLKQLIDLHEKTNANIIGIQEVAKEDVSKYGIIEYSNKENRKIKTLIEKPSIEDAPSTSAGVGRYIFNPTIFDELDKISVCKDGEYKLTDAMLNLMQYEDFYGCEFDGKYFDIGNQLGYLKANIEFALIREDLKENMKKYLKDINK